MGRSRTQREAISNKMRRKASQVTLEEKLKRKQKALEDKKNWQIALKEAEEKVCGSCTENKKCYSKCNKLMKHAKEILSIIEFIKKRRENP